MSTPPHPMPSAAVVLALTLLLGIQPVATDLYLPALPAITQSFGASMGQAQLTLTALLLAFGISQLVWGPLSDRYGRRPILLTGVAAFTAASLASAFAESMEQLIFWRVVQGVAMGASVMCARALVRDLFIPSEGAKMMTKGLTGLGFIACASAPLGGILAQAWGWRTALAALAGFGAITWLFLLLRFRETLHHRNPSALQPRTLWNNWRLILSHPTFRAFALLSTTSYCGLFTFLATSSFVFIGILGQSKALYGLLMLSTSASYILGTFMCRALLARFGVRRTVAIGAVFTLAGGTLMATLSLAGVRGVWPIMLPLYLFMLGHGVHQPCGQSGTVASFPQAAGTASAMSGFLMMLTVFIVGSWMGQFLSTGVDASVLPLTLGMGFWSVMIALTAWTLVQRHGEPRPAPQRQSVPDSK